MADWPSLGSTPLAGIYGGTGLSVAAVGDLLYASATTPTWSRLAAVALKQVLISQGVNVAPAWSATPTVSGITVNNNAAALPGPAFGPVQAASADAVETHFTADAFAALSRFVGRRANGTAASRTAIASADFISAWNVNAYNGSAYIGVVSLLAQATQTHSGAQSGTKVELYATLDGAIAASLVVGFQAGMVIGAPTGGYKGAGTLNAAGAYYANGTAGVATFGPAAVVSITVKNGLVTAIS